MGRRKVIDTHPQRNEIIAAVVNGDTYSSISGRFGISRGVITGMIRGELASRIARAKREADVIDATFVLQTAGKASKALSQMLDACSVYLQDPDDPDAFDVGPRADEVDLVREIRDEDGKVVRTERGTLQEFLDAVDGQMPGVTESVKYRHADPRSLVISAADAVNRQLAVIAKIRSEAIRIGENREERLATVQSEEWNRMAEVIVEASRECPQIAQKVKEELDLIYGDATDTV